MPHRARKSMVRAYDLWAPLPATVSADAVSQEESEKMSHKISAIPSLEKRTNEAIAGFSAFYTNDIWSGANTKFPFKYRVWASRWLNHKSEPIEALALASEIKYSAESISFPYHGVNCRAALRDNPVEEMAYGLLLTAAAVHGCWASLYDEDAPHKNITFLSWADDESWRVRQLTAYLL